MHDTNKTRNFPPRVSSFQTITIYNGLGELPLKLEICLLACQTVFSLKFCMYLVFREKYALKSLSVSIDEKIHFKLCQYITEFSYTNFIFADTNTKMRPKEKL